MTYDDIAIRVENLGKRYRLGLTHRGTIRDALHGLGRRLFGRNGKSPTPDTRHPTPSSPLTPDTRHLTPRANDQAPMTNGQKDFWALREVSFEVRRGEVLGIIGRNGAGKSTLLKILSRVTKPTTGRAEIIGRVGSLLEVGTGFHPELTGRENVYLNGAILGMTKREIDRNFDEIVDFAAVEKFMDTPVKRYSSGMHVRLGFAVAAHFEPEVLIVDEVLAVGDVSFQRKCLGKMGEVATQGRTVLLVSHNMGSINQLCPQSVWLDDGMIKELGPSSQTIAAYVQDGQEVGCSVGPKYFEENRSKEVQLRSVDLVDDNGRTARSFDCDHPVCIDIDLQVRRSTPGLYGYLDVRKMDGTVVMMSDSYDAPPNPLDNLATGYHYIRMTIPPRTLAPGDYQVYLNFSCRCGQLGHLDSPGIIGQFRLDDFTTKRGNQRTGFFSSIVTWREIDSASHRHKRHRFTDKASVSQHE